MKKSGLLPGFLPLIVFGAIAVISGVTIALAAATVAAIVVGWTDLRKGMILSWANLVLFGSMLVAIGILGMTCIIPYMGILIYAALASVTFGSILLKKAFTLQYARGMVEKALWDKPLFIRVNVFMTGIWGGIFSINAGLNAIALVTPGLAGHIFQVLTYIVLISGIIFTMGYPGHIRKKYAPVPMQNTR
ncbi:hypothetical protein [Methanoregula sp.]|uniref:hypothetical protein n=1 Tax=Methanoregula sp. TaxID=2052170 RepID=UPI003BB045DF